MERGRGRNHAFQKARGQPDYETKIIPKLSYAVAKAIDSYIAAKFNEFSQIVGAEGVKVTWEVLLAAKAYLDLADAPEDDRFLIIDPATLQDLMQEELFTSTLYGANDAVSKGWIGQQKVLNCKVFMTNNLEAINTNYHGAAMFQREALAAAVPDGGVRIETWEEKARHTTFHRASAWYGAVEVRDTLGVWIKTRA